ncbi:Golgi to ER traffic- protein [Puccinia graminis f. sp. tritici]|uniref:Golgi to ER traffic-protein n=1 Tax=Puccinia graminis f. sp. tritici TaxID=56615 RepID=A0A5B0RY76_PUCGR|nr:Golgi to ER traffic- protein [Puccinia graminis f. sp. tritici]
MFSSPPPSIQITSRNQLHIIRPPTARQPSVLRYVKLFLSRDSSSGRRATTPPLNVANYLTINAPERPALPSPSIKITSRNLTPTARQPDLLTTSPSLPQNVRLSIPFYPNHTTEPSTTEYHPHLSFCRRAKIASSAREDRLQFSYTSFWLQPSGSPVFDHLLSSRRLSATHHSDSNCPAAQCPPVCQTFLKPLFFLRSSRDNPPLRFANYLTIPAPERPALHPLPSKSHHGTNYDWISQSPEPWSSREDRLQISYTFWLQPSGSPVSGMSNFLSSHYPSSGRRATTPPLNVANYLTIPAPERPALPSPSIKITSHNLTPTARQPAFVVARRLPPQLAKIASRSATHHSGSNRQAAQSPVSQTFYQAVSSSRRATTPPLNVANYLTIPAPERPALPPPLSKSHHELITTKSLNPLSFCRRTKIASSATPHHSDSNRQTAQCPNIQLFIPLHPNHTKKLDTIRQAAQCPSSAIKIGLSSASVCPFTSTLTYLTELTGTSISSTSKSTHYPGTPITMMFTPESTPLRNPPPAGKPANTTVTQFLPPHAYQQPSQISNHQTKSSIIPIGTHPATPAPEERPVEPPEGSQSVTEVQYMVESMQVRCCHLKRVHARFSGRAPNLDTFHQAYVDALEAFVTEGMRKLEEAELAEQTHISVPVDVSSASKTSCSTEGVSSSPAQSELTIPNNGSDVQAQPHDPHLQVACTRQPPEFSVAPMDLDQAWRLLKNGTTTNINKLWPLDICPISAFPLPSEQITDPVDRFVDLDQTEPTRIQEGTSNSSIVTIRRSTPVDSTSILLLGGPQLKRTLSCQTLVSTEAVLGRSVKRIKSFDHGTQHLIESRRPSEDTRAQANLSQHETHPQTKSHLNEKAASLEPSDMECSDDEANPQESAADSQASSHSSDLVVRPKNPVTTKNHHQSPKSALPLDDLPTTEQAKSAPLGSKLTSISTSSPATSGDPSDDSAAPRTDKTLELPSDSPAVQHRTSQPPPSTNVPPKQATTDCERVEETLELSSNVSAVQDRTSQPPPSTNVPPKQATTATDQQSQEKSANPGTSGADFATQQTDETPDLPDNSSETTTVSTSPKDLSASLPASRPDVELLKSANIGTSGADSATQRADDTLDLPLNPSGATTVTNAQNASSDETPDLPNSASEATTVSDSEKAFSAPLPAPRPDVELSKSANGGLSGAGSATQRADETLNPSEATTATNSQSASKAPGTSGADETLDLPPNPSGATPANSSEATTANKSQNASSASSQTQRTELPQESSRTTSNHTTASKEQPGSTDERSTTPASEPPHDIDHNADQEPPPPYEDLPSHSRTPRKAAIDSRKRNSGASAGPSSSKPRKRKKTSKTDENPPEGTDSEAESNFEILEGPINLTRLIRPTSLKNGSDLKEILEDIKCNGTDAAVHMFAMFGDIIDVNRLHRRLKPGTHLTASLATPQDTNLPSVLATSSQLWSEHAPDIHKRSFLDIIDSCPRLFQLPWPHPFFNTKHVRMHVLTLGVDEILGETRAGGWAALNQMMCRSTEKGHHHQWDFKKTVSEGSRRVHQLVMDSAKLLKPSEGELPEATVRDSAQEVETGSLRRVGVWLSDQVTALDAADPKEQSHTAHIEGLNFVVKRAWEMLHGASILYDAIETYKRKQKEKGKSPKNKKNTPNPPKNTSKSRTNVSKNPDSKKAKDQLHAKKLKSCSSLILFLNFGVAGWFHCHMNHRKFNLRDLTSLMGLCDEMASNKVTINTPLTKIDGSTRQETREPIHRAWERLNDYLLDLLVETDMGSEKVDWCDAAQFWSAHLKAEALAPLVIKDLFDEISKPGDTLSSTGGPAPTPQFNRPYFTEWQSRVKNLFIPKELHKRLELQRMKKLGVVQPDPYAEDASDEETEDKDEEMDDEDEDELGPGENYRLDEGDEDEEEEDEEDEDDPMVYP